MKNTDIPHEINVPERDIVDGLLPEIIVWPNYFNNFNFLPNGA